MLLNVNSVYVYIIGNIHGSEANTINYFQGNFRLEFPSKFQVIID